jgi:hypothetical protein
MCQPETTDGVGERLHSFLKMEVGNPERRVVVRQRLYTRLVKRGAIFQLVVDVADCEIIERRC